MSENSRSAWGNGDEAEKAAVEAQGMDRKVADLETRSEGDKPGTFAQMLRAMAQAAREGGDGAKLTPEEQIKRLTGFAQRYHELAYKRFQVGDVVTASANTYLRNAGTPSIVIEIREPHSSDETIDSAKLPGSSEVEPGHLSYGLLFDMRVLKIHPDGEVYPMWVESWTHEKWTPPADKAA